MQAMQSEEKLEVLKEPETDVDVPEEHNTDIDEREEQIENVVSAIIQRKYSGPIPPPSSLRDMKRFYQDPRTEFSLWQSDNLNTDRIWKRKW